MDDMNKKLNPQDFEFIQMNEKIYDKKLETKPIGYFKDAMIRFSKNKTNVVASIILAIIVLFSIFLPVFSDKNVSEIEEQLSFLPPRVPVLENIGIFDGTSLITNQVVHPDSVNPETGLGSPEGIPEELIVEGTLVNSITGCTDKNDYCVGGEQIFRLDTGSDFVTIGATNFFEFDKSKESMLAVEVQELSAGAEIRVMVEPAFGQDHETVYTITEAGTHNINIFEVLTDKNRVTSKLWLQFASNDDSATSVIKSVSLSDNTQAEPIIYDEGYSLSQYVIIGGQGAGAYLRQNGTMITADFRYKNYEAAFGEKFNNALPASEYDEILAQYPEVCVATPDPDNPEGWMFQEGCPIVRVVAQNESVTVNGEDYFSYQVVLDYARYSGYDDIPYFLFGTTKIGRDLFKLLWIATRTSLLVGLVVATINITIGVVYGSISGYYGGKVDLIMQRIAEVLGRIPWLVTLSIFVALIGTGIKTLILMMVINGWIGISAVTRTQFYRYKGREYVLASRTLGAKDSRLIFRHILPNGVGTIITASVLSIPGVIFLESTLSYLGYGIGHGQVFNILGIEFSGVSVGVLLFDARPELTTRPYLTLFPAILISILMITFNMFGNALRDAFNPSLRGSE